MYKYKIIYTNGENEIKTFNKVSGIGSISEFIVDTNRDIPVMGYRKIQ